MTPSEIIDRATFAGLLDNLGGDVDFLGELVETYLASSPELVAGIQQAIAAGDAPTLQRAAHSLKSGSASFGALAFAAQCRELEEFGKTGALAEAQLKSAALAEVYAQVAAALQAELHTARRSPA
ncbi:MAG: Hpt domain-containing protein [Anaerolineae bacterium]|nr:Hpt domain-containing protein [Anaerolineae bacterium]